jgi:hypothetical protein
VANGIQVVQVDVYPIIGPEIATYGVVQPLARQIGLTTLGTLHQRVGDTLGPAAGDDRQGWLRSAWGRVVGDQIDNRYQAFTEPSASGRWSACKWESMCGAAASLPAITTARAFTSLTSTAVSM